MKSTVPTQKEASDLLHLVSMPETQHGGCQVLQQPEDLDKLASQLAGRHAAVIHRQVARLDTAYRTLNAAAHLPTQESQEICLRRSLEAYFVEVHKLLTLSFSQSVLRTHQQCH